MFFLYQDMHKSAITFGVLLTSLVMLAIMPLLNNNNFSNIAMDQGYKIILKLSLALENPNVLIL
jgi:hypothetical protein